jgi:serpin B
MMSRREDAKYAEGTGYQAVEIPYKGGRFRMVIVLPAEGQFDIVESSLDGEFANSVLRGFDSEDTKLYLPKFQYETSLSLAKTLGDMGMPDAFSAKQADFSGMAEIPPNLYISHVEHKAFIAVDEIGTEAAAATGVVAEIESMPVVLKVNRPFIFLIRDSESGTILFIGRVTNPAAQ